MQGSATKHSTAALADQASGSLLLSVTSSGGSALSASAALRLPVALALGLEGRSNACNALSNVSVAAPDDDDDAADPLGGAGPSGLGGGDSGSAFFGTAGGGLPFALGSVACGRK